MKRFHTIDEMISLLRERGLYIEDEASARRTLLNDNYYRLSGFFRQLQRDHRGGDPRFIEGSTFDQVVRLHRCDRQFARLCGDALADIECALRSRFAYFSAQASGGAAFYLQPTYYYESMPDRSVHVDRVQDELARSKSAMVAHYRSTDGDVTGVPIWVAVEVLPFGSISRMIEYSADPTASRETAHSVSHQWESFASTVHSLAVFRNRCAHHGQIWHRPLDVHTPRKRSDLKHAPDHHPQGPYPAILAMKRLSKAIGAPDHPYEQIDRLLETDAEYAAGILKPQPK